MNIKELMYQRRSCRHFNDKLVTDEDMLTILKCAMSAPTAHNLQPWKFLVVSNQEILEKLRKTTPFTNYSYPQAIVICGTIDEKKDQVLNDYWQQGCSAAVQNILLTATSLGYASLWMGLYPNVDGATKTKEILNITDSSIPMAIIGLGKSDRELKLKTWYDESKVSFIK